MSSSFRNSPGSSARPQCLNSVSFLLSALNLSNNRYRREIYSTCPSPHVDCLQLHRYSCTCTAVQVLLHRYSCTSTSAQVLLHRYSCICRAAQVLLHMYSCTGTSAQVQLHRYSCTVSGCHSSPHPHVFVSILYFQLSVAVCL
jgi:hypothetical protein